MSGVAWPAVRARLASALPTVVGSTVVVQDGPLISGTNPAAYLTIGFQASSGSTSAGLFDQENGLDGYSATERGTVLAELGAITGETAVPDVFSTFALIAAWVQSDLTLGGTLPHGATVAVSAEVTEAQTSSGAVQRLLVVFTYTTNVI
jgi:hypothetical protein